MPKKSGILRPLTLLSFRDLIVYQSIINIIADRMKPEQDIHAYEQAFGAVYAGQDSEFFFRPWKKGYEAYTNTVKSAFNRGNNYVADFDLVSCYELIDHNLLCSCIESRVKYGGPQILDSSGASICYGPPPFIPSRIPVRWTSPGVRYASD